MELDIVFAAGDVLRAVSLRSAEQAPPLSPAWLADLDLDAYTRLTGWPVENAARPGPFTYVTAPQVTGHAVAATLEDSSSYRRRPFHVRIEGIAPTLRWTCSGGPDPLALPLPVVLLLGDLAISRDLREALLAGRPTGPAVAGLPQAREAFLAARRLVTVVDGWAPASPGGHLSIEVEIGAATRYHEFDGPSVILRLRAPGNRRVLTIGELEAMRLSPDLRRVVSLCANLIGKAGIAATGGCAALVLELLRDHPEWPIRGLNISTTPVRLELTRGRAEKVVSRDWGGPIYPWKQALAPSKPTTIDALLAWWSTEGRTFEAPAEDVDLFIGPVSFVHRRGTRQVFPVHPSIDTTVALRLQQTPILEVPEGAWEAVHRRLQVRLGGTGVSLPTRASVGLPEAAAPVLTLRVDGSPLDVYATLEAAYGGAPVPVLPSPDGALLGEAGPARDLATERAAVERVLGCGMYATPDQRGFAAAEAAAVAFWTEGLPRLRGEGAPAVQIFLSEKLAGVRVRGPVKIRVKTALVQGWLDTSVSFEADDLSAEMSALHEAIGKKRRWVLLRDGSIAAVPPEALALAAEVSPLLDATGRARLSLPQIGLLEHWASAAERVEVDPAVEALRARLRSLDVRPAEVPAGLTATLRPYQVAGLAWLQFLTELSTGGILADDMGLGKTLMALAFLQWKKEKGAAGPALVVCPTSVVGNWVREAARFAPGLRVLSLTGPSRASRLAEIGAVDLVVTTYTLLRLDVEQLAGVLFHTVLLDEAQNVKNSGAATRQAAKRLRGDQRLALTGTPVENRLGELWSILDLVSPGMLGTERSFEARFERPIALEPGGRAAAELRARVRPFVLRRTKAQVLTELPPKQEIDVTCLPGAAQRKAYDALAALVRGDVERSVESQGLARSGLIVLTALLRLRQMSCDPRLVDPTRPAAMSAKREAFLSLVRELRDEGRRALVFSQFVELLTLWRADLDREGIAYEYLDGSTTRRDDVIARFQNGNAPLFLLSLKAGGAGLNLTAADTVIHCDPWWNPAVEMQATDRAHRMGQARAVTVYRLILRGSIEEKIAELKAKKRAIADAVIHDDGGALRGLDQSDVRLLLSSVDEGELGDMDPDADVIEVPAAPEPREPVSTTAVRTSPKGRRPPPAALPAALPAAPPTTVSEHRAAPAALPAALPAAPPTTVSEHRAAPAVEIDTQGGDLEGEPLESLIRQMHEHLREHGMMQKQLAMRAGLSQPQISLILHGRVPRLKGAVAARIREAMAG